MKQYVQHTIKIYQNGLYSDLREAQPLEEIHFEFLPDPKEQDWEMPPILSRTQLALILGQHGYKLSDMVLEDSPYDPDITFLMLKPIEDRTEIRCCRKCKRSIYRQGFQRFLREPGKPDININDLEFLRRLDGVWPHLRPGFHRYIRSHIGFPGAGR